MKTYFFPVCLIWLCTIQSSAQHLFLEAEDFQFKGGWNQTHENGSFGAGILMVTMGGGPAADAVTVIDVVHAESYTVWVRSKDYATQGPGTRLSCVMVNQQRLNQQGRHGRDGFYWEKVGSANMVKGYNVIRLHDTKANYARVDAVLFTTHDSFNPNEYSEAAIAQFRTKPVAVKLEGTGAETVFTPATIPDSYTEAGQIGNDYIRLRIFTSSKEDSSRLYTKIESLHGGEWVSIANKIEDSRISLIKTNLTSISYANYVPSWSSTRVKKYIDVHGFKYDITEKEDASNPYLAGNTLPAIPRKIKSISASAVELYYTVSGGDTLTVLWSIAPDKFHFDLEISYTVKKEGYYSFAVDALQGVDPTQVSNVQLSPLYQYQRIPRAPTLIPLAMSPQPVSIVEIRNEVNNPFSFFITGDPLQYSRTWGAYDFGLGLKDINNKVQPVAFSPVLGLKDSYNPGGSLLRKSFKVGMLPMGWHNVLEYVSDSIYRVRDYRKQSTSITQALFNMIDLMKDDRASGWSVVRKGFLDIESDPARLTEVAQSSPLAVLSAAVLTNDEDLYIRRALPIIEFTLSRKGYRWGIPTKNHSNVHINEFNPFVSQFNTAYFEGLSFLLDGKNPWIKKLALPNNLPRYSKGYGVNEGWTGDLAAYKLTGLPEWLTRTREKADAFVSQELLGKKNTLLNPIVFYNVSSYPAWFDLLDLYDLTADRKYLTAAMYGAYFTIAGIRTYPMVNAGQQLIHTNGKYAGNSQMFWKENARFKLGYPRTPGDLVEKSVSIADVSPVGLGFEQPTTMFTGKDNTQSVYMSSWAPSLLRLNNTGQHQFFEVYARNAVIGRFSNYPGYYAAGYTDLVLDSIYPYKGPDVTSIYYHHIPAHLAFSLDFLVAEAIQRSKGEISFPYSRQQGFVWFNNRVYGRQQGLIGKEKVSLFLNKHIMRISNPALNYLTAISESKLFLILLNESDAEEAVHIKMDGFKGYVASQSVHRSVKPKGMEIISFPLLKPYHYPNKDLHPVTDGMKIIDLGKSLGKLYLYRIRSPFGWDSIYGFINNDIRKNSAQVKASLSPEDSDANDYKTSFPYEWSFMKIKPSEKVSLVLSVFRDNQQIKKERVQM